MNGHLRGEESLRNNEMVWVWALGVADLIIQRKVYVEDGTENCCEGEMRGGGRYEAEIETSMKEEFNTTDKKFWPGGLRVTSRNLTIFSNVWTL